MRVTVTSIDIEPAELVQLRQVLGLDVIEAKLTVIEEVGYQIMAQFDQLNAKIDEVNTAVADVASRAAEDVQALKDQIANLELDTDDQAAIDAIVTRLDGTVQALQAIDPVPAAGGGDV